MLLRAAGVKDLSQIFNFRKQVHTSLLLSLSRLPRILRRVQLMPQRIQAFIAAALGLALLKGVPNRSKSIIENVID